MGTFFSGKFDPTFVPDEKQVNAIKGLLVGCVEGLSECSSGEATPDVDWNWIAQNISAANERMNELFGVGFVWQHTSYTWNHRDEEIEEYSLGLTDEALDWARRNLGLPEGLDMFEQNDALVAYVQSIEGTFKRKGTRKNGAASTEAKGVKTTTEWVRQESYTQEEAAEAHARIILTSRLTKGGKAAEKAHVTRRTPGKSVRLDLVAAALERLSKEQKRGRTA